MSLETDAADPRLLPGDNNPPPPTLDEELAEEVAEALARTVELVAAANLAIMNSAETQRQTTALAGLIKTHFDEVEPKRKARKQPFDQGALAVQRHYKPVLDPLTDALNRLRSLNDAYEAEQDRLREAERRRLAEEEAAKRREAEEAARKAEEARAAGKSGLAAELAAVKARDEAAAAARAQERAAAAPPPVRTDLGSAGRTTVASYEIVDLTACLGYLRKAQRANLVEVIQPLINRLGRAKVLIPGVKVTEQKATRFGR